MRFTALKKTDLYSENPIQALAEWADERNIIITPTWLKQNLPVSMLKTLEQYAKDNHLVLDHTINYTKKIQKYNRAGCSMYYDKLQEKTRLVHINEVDADPDRYAHIKSKEYKNDM